MQVTDAMVAAAMKAFRLQPADLNVPDPEGMYIDHRRMRDALQAALDASPEQAMPQMWPALPQEEGFKDSSVAKIDALFGVLPRDAHGRVTIATVADDLAPRTGGRVWLHTEASSERSEGPDMPDDTTKQPAPGFDASTPAALGSFTVPLGSDAFKFLDPDQVAEHLGVTALQVDEWIRLGSSIRFPEPYKWASGIPSWQLAVIDQWYALWKASNGG